MNLPLFVLFLVPYSCDYTLSKCAGRIRLKQGLRKWKRTINKEEAGLIGFIKHVFLMSSAVVALPFLRY